MELNELFVEDFGEDFAWLDTGTHESLLEARPIYSSNRKERQNLKLLVLRKLLVVMDGFR